MSNEKTDNLSSLYGAPAASSEVFRQMRCVREAAFMRFLHRLGTQFDPGVADAMFDRVSAVAAEFYATPEETGQAIDFHDPDY